MGKNTDKPVYVPHGSFDDDVEPGEDGLNGHSEAFHMARVELLESELNKERLTWDDYKKKHKDALNDVLADGEERKMIAYRKELDAAREAQLSRGTNHKKGKKEKKEKKKDKKKEKKKDKKREKKDKGEDSEEGSKKRKKVEEGGGYGYKMVRLSDFHEHEDSE
eukprot:TRINITY_DN5044_c0_g2_i2.p3 TRINITY_DN5044_c0_g2~~TRINITY_DN5044_c0_g2_i2.p3  ORF type:complete len:164 (+),score=68.89 TRINITY_DN5044_c0_g2_i2:100-591(+)